MKRFFIRLAFLLLALSLPAEEGKTTVLARPLERENIGIDDASFIESLLYSYLAAMSDITVLLEEDAADGRPVDYELFGSLSRDEQNDRITLHLKRRKTNDIVSHTSAHKNNADMALKLRSIVQTLFREPAAGGANGAAPVGPEEMTPDAVAGLWRADNGIELVNFQRDGTGIAFFSSGERMSLKFTIEDNVLKVIQNSPNRERYYQGLPYELVRELTLTAQPLYFELQLFDNGAALRGKRIETTAAQEAGKKIRLSHNTERETEWKRNTR
jgi:hypothetical protein